MSKNKQTLITVLVSLLLAIISALAVLNRSEIAGIKINGATLVIVTGIFSFLGVLLGALINKLVLWFAKMGQEERQTVPFMQSWYATSVSTLPFTLVNVFLVTVVNAYKAGNGIANLISALVASLLYTFILRRQKAITARTQIIYVVITLLLTLLTNFLPAAR